VTGHNGSWHGGITGSFTVFITGDTAVPSSACDVAGAYWRTTAPIAITATASDASPSSGIAYVELFYRYGATNGTFGAWTSAGADAGAPWQWSFGFPSGSGFYEFYTLGNDTIGNLEAAPASADLRHAYDNAAPASACDVTGAYWRSASPMTITATANDNLATTAVELWYRYGAANGTWTTGWTLSSTDTAAPWSFGFAFADGQGYYEFHTRAYDAAANYEGAPATADVGYGYDTGVPSSACDVVGAYWRATASMTITATASDAGSGPSMVTLFYRYSAANVTFGGWIPFGNDSAAPWSWSFNFPASQGHYEFYTLAMDAAGNMEASPASADVRHGYDSVAPATVVGALPGTIDSLSPRTINATGADATSGIMSVSLWYCFNGGAWTNFGADAAAPYQFSFTWPAGEGTYAFYSTGADMAGNPEAAPSGNDTWTVVLLDSVGPATTLAIGAPNLTSANATFVTPSTPLNLTASDNISGVASIWYRVWNGTWSNWTLYHGNFTLAGTTVIAYLEFNATDGRGNHEAANNRTFLVDSNPPIPTLTISAPRSGLHPVYVTTATDFNLTASDGVSGVAKLWYRVDAGAWTLYSGDFSLATVGAHNVSVIAQDRLAQNSTAQTYYVFVDSIAPVTVIGVGSPSFSTAPVFVNSSTQINLTATDGGAGVDITMYRVDGGNWKTYSVPLNFTIAGLHLVEYRTLDNLGNAETIQSLELFVDDLSPIIDWIFGTPNQRTSPTYVTSATTLTLTASDAGCGLAGVWCSIDNGTWVQYSAPLVFSSAGAHSVRYYAADSLGQQSATATIDLFVDGDAPFVYTAPGVSGGVIALAKGANVTLWSTDGVGAGGQVIYYSLDGGETWTQYTAPLVFEASATLMFYAEDALGNQAATKTVSIDVSGGGGIGNIWWIILIALVVVALVVYILLRNKGKDSGKETVEEGEDEDIQADKDGDAPAEK
jgi:hypothetical protein